MKGLTSMDFFRKHQEYGPIFLRLLIGIFIIWGVQDNVFSQEHMQEFADFLEARGFPYPKLGAYLSAYTQMLCGLSILFGAAIRLTSIAFIINFIFAIIIAHRGDTFRGMFPALMMISAGLFFLFHGAGRLSIDEWWERRTMRNNSTRAGQAL